MDQQKRFLLAMVLCALIVMAWQYLFPPPVVPDQVVEPSAEIMGQLEGDAQGVTRAVSDQAEAPTPTKAVAQRASTLKTENFVVTLTNAGAAIQGVRLLKPEQYVAAGDLLGELPEGDKARYPFTVGFEKGAIALPEGVVYEVAEESASSVLYRHVDPQGRYVIERGYQVNAEHPYLLDATIAITNSSADAPLVDVMTLTMTGYDDPEKESSFLEFRSDEVEGLCHSEEDTERELSSALDPEDLTTLNKDVTWGAVNTRYFLWGWIPQEEAEACAIRKQGDYVTTTLTWADVSIPPSSTYTYQSTLYAGPKDLDVLKELGAGLEESVDYGIWTVAAKPLRWLLNWFYTWVGNWGLAIILLTLLIKAVTWPLTEKSYANSERMKDIQPELDALRKKHENDQQRIAKETMDLFKANKFNSLGGCLPMLVQTPILYSLFVMINNSVELYQADFILWYTDLSAKDPYFVLPILMGVMMLIQQHFMTPKSSGDGPNQQAMAMMKFMPIMFTAMMLFLPSGLVLYHSLNLVLGVFQQWLIRRKFAKRRAARGNVVVESL